MGDFAGGNSRFKGPGSLWKTSWKGKVPYAEMAWFLDFSDEAIVGQYYEDTGGVLVTDVDPNGPAAEAGIQRGDVIIELDRKAVGNVDDLTRKLDNTKESVLVLVRRGQNTLFVPLKRAG